MSFNSLDQVLASVEQQPGWETYRQYRHLLECWQLIVKPNVALETRPLYIVRQVLWVATSSSVWAQTLSLQRYSLLKKLNAHLPEPLVDIRFSTAQWYNQNKVSGSVSSITQAQHPSLITPDETSSCLPQLSVQNTPQSAFQRWAEAIRLRAQNLPLCPQCQSPTPPGELERWHLCAYCAPKNWHEVSI